jgi:segregation and condensation protein B
MLRQLLERDLIRIVGRAEDLGRPLLYGTTKRFLELFGLRHLDELPRAAEFQTVPQSISSSDEPATNIQHDSNPDTGRADETKSIDSTLEEKSVTTRIRPATTPDQFVEQPLTALTEAARRQSAAKPLSAAKEEDDEEDDEEDEDDLEDDDEEDEDWEDDDDEEDEEDDDDADDDFVDEEWEEVDDDEEEDEDEEDDDEDDEDWDEDEDEDWDDDDEDEDEEWKEGEKK